MSELEAFLIQKASYSLGLPVSVDFGVPHGNYWSTVFNAKTALREVIEPLLAAAEEVRAYSYRWESAATDPDSIELRQRIEHRMIEQNKEQILLDLNKDLVFGMERFWFGGIPRLMTVVPLVTVPFDRIGMLEEVFSRCSAEGATSGANRGLYAAAVRSARKFSLANRIVFVFRGEELEAFYPKEHGECRVLADMIDGLCMTSRDLRAKLSRAIEVEKKLRREAGELI